MILIKNTTIIDGTGKPPFKGDVLIKDDRISAIGTLVNQKADQVIDGLGLTVAPGFINTNTDSDHYLSLLTSPLQKDFLLQGITTIIGGLCGSSLAPLLYGSLKSIRKWTDINQVNINWQTLAQFKDSLRQLRLGVNFGTLVGHSTVRRDLIGEEIRDLTQGELDILKEALKLALKEGALGLSTGLGYTHSRVVPYSEIKSLLPVVAQYHGVYATHLRDEQENLLKSVEETILAAQESGVPTIISHFRPIIGFEDQFLQAIKLIEGSLSSANIYFDVNPFNVSVVPIYTLLPQWAQHNNLEAMSEIIDNSLHLPKIKQDFQRRISQLEDAVIVEAQGNPSLDNVSLKNFSENRGLALPEAVAELMNITRMKALIYYKNINSDLLSQVLLHQRALIGTNSASLDNDPSIIMLERSTQTFSRYIAAAESKNIPLEEIIKRITSVPAKIFGIGKRGVLREGWFADCAILKNKKVVGTIVNGVVAVSNGSLAAARGSGVPL